MDRIGVDFRDGTRGGRNRPEMGTGREMAGRRGRGEKGARRGDGGARRGRSEARRGRSEARRRGRVRGEEGNGTRRRGRMQGGEKGGKRRFLVEEQEKKAKKGTETRAGVVFLVTNFPGPDPGRGRPGPSFDRFRPAEECSDGCSKGGKWRKHRSKSRSSTPFDTL